MQTQMEIDGITHTAIGSAAKVLPVQEYEFPDYTIMIQRLFKRMEDTNNPHHDLMHAAIGLAGEAVELNNVVDHKNFIEEAGDLEFYIEAAVQQLPEGCRVAVDLSAEQETAAPLALQHCLQNVVNQTGDFLDLAKKSWVYRKDMDYDKAVRMLCTLTDLLSRLYRIFGTTRAEVKYCNQYKLIGPGGRFRSGFYSDSDAQARADKAGEDVPNTAQRSFIGMQK